MRISALARMRESRPSAATARAARTVSPSAKVRQAVSPPPSKAMAASGRIVRRGSPAAAAARRDTSRPFSTFQPNASRPISPAENETGGGRNRLPVSSMMRMTASGAASAARAGQTPSACRKRTDPSRSAMVRPSSRGSGRPTRAVAKPSRAKASAAARPAAPAPTTAMSKSRLTVADVPIAVARAAWPRRLAARRGRR